MFVQQLELVVRKKLQIKVTRNEGWFSESDLKVELEWSTWDAQFLRLFETNSWTAALPCFHLIFMGFLLALRAKTAGVKKVCEKSPKTHIRRGLELYHSSTRVNLPAYTCQVQPLRWAVGVLGCDSGNSWTYGKQDNGGKLSWEQEGRFCWEFFTKWCLKF